MQVNALDYLAQHLVALLDPSDIVANLYDAYRDPLQDGTLRRAGYGAVRDRRHRECVDSGGAGRPQSDGAADLAAGKGSRRPIARISTWQKSTRVSASGALLLWRSRGIVRVHYKNNY